LYTANERIKFAEIRVSFPDGDSQVMSTKEALAKAKEMELDLVLIAEKAQPPVCRIIALNKHLYELKQKQKLAKKKQRESIVEIKEIRMGVNIDIHDLETKANMARKFLDKNNKLTVMVTMKGRERGRPESAKEVLNKFAEKLNIKFEHISVQSHRVTGKT
jgi:translation initiation factor IF-3